MEKKFEVKEINTNIDLFKIKTVKIFILNMKCFNVHTNILTCDFIYNQSS